MDTRAKVVAKLTAPPQSMVARTTGSRQTKRSPSARSATIGCPVRGGPVRGGPVRGRAGSGARSRVIANAQPR